MKMSINQVTKREPINLAIKRHIRLYHMENEKLTVGDMVSWAEEKYGIPFLPATIRTILFAKPTKSKAFATLHTSCTEGHRERGGNWPELEIELAKWHRCRVAPPEGEEVKEKAKELWQELAPKHYTGQKQPTFGDSWRDKFKTRHEFKLKKAPDGYALIDRGSPPALAQERDNIQDRGDSTNADIPWDVGDEALGISVMQSFPSKHKTTSSEAHLYRGSLICLQSLFQCRIANTLRDAFAGLDYAKSTTPPAFANAALPIPIDKLQDNTLYQITLPSPNTTSGPSIESTVGNAQDSTFETISSSWHQTISPSLESRYL
jgi:hypothetical protein